MKYLASATVRCANISNNIWKGGIERLKEVNFYRPGSELEEFSGRMEEYFTKNPPSSILHASAVMEEITGIRRSETQVRKFMKSMNFRFMKCGTIPAKALDESKKRAAGIFGKKLEPRLAEAGEGKRTVYSADAAHFVWDAFLGYL